MDQTWSCIVRLHYSLRAAFADLLADYRKRPKRQHVHQFGCSAVFYFAADVLARLSYRKKDLRNQNRKKDGSQVSLLTMFLRVIVAGLVYCITFGLGLIASLILIAVREDKRTLHDLIAGTYVTYATPGEEELNADEEIRKSE